MSYMPNISMSGLQAGGHAAGSIGAGWLGGPWGAAAMALLPSLLGGLLGRNDPNARARRQVQDILDPWNIERQGRDLYTSTMSGPGMQAAHSAIASGGAQALQTLTGNLARRGLNFSGVGSALPAAVQSGTGIAQGRLAASAWEQAMQNAQQRAYQRASVLSGMPTTPNYTANLFSGGLNSLLYYLLNKGQQQQPQQAWR